MTSNHLPPTAGQSQPMVFVIGYPSDIGGANTELWHTVKLWRRFGLPVTLVPTWQADPLWKARLDSIGCRTVVSNPDDLENVPGLAGGVVVSLCNTKFLAVADRIRRLGCRVVWLGCMNWLFPAERLHCTRHGCFDRHVFQSRYQRDQLVPQLRRFGFDDGQARVIRGPLDADEFPFAPRAHTPGEPLVIGRISRPAREKFARNLWQIYGRTPHPVYARLLGWGPDIEARLGRPPQWAECLPSCAEPVAGFLGQLHAMVHAGGAAVENWPRVGLEAMAAGVPLVVDASGGWTEMIEHGHTGYLCRTEDEFAHCTARLACDEEHRLAIARAAREKLVMDLACPETIWAQWRAVFAELQNAETTTPPSLPRR
jgi:glycosyltransferase involved in cell wall biosynthesis